MFSWPQNNVKTNLLQITYRRKFTFACSKNIVTVFILAIYFLLQLQRRGQLYRLLWLTSGACKRPADIMDVLTSFWQMSRRRHDNRCRNFINNFSSST